VQAGGTGGGYLEREPTPLAGGRVGSGLDVDPKRPGGKLLDVASGGGDHDKTIKPNTHIRSTIHSAEANMGVRIKLSSWGAAYRNRTDDLRITSASL
jgi:hypothetical protein